MPKFLKGFKYALHSYAVQQLLKVLFICCSGHVVNHIVGVVYWFQDDSSYVVARYKNACWKLLHVYYRGRLGLKIYGGRKKKNSVDSHPNYLVSALGDRCIFVCENYAFHR
jgi:hypothetical protein